MSRKIIHNNIPIILEKDSSAKINTIIFGFKIGSRNEDPNESGLCHFLEHMAFKSTKSKSAMEISKEIENFGGMVNACTSTEFTFYYISALPEYTQKIIHILTDILQNSTYPQKEIDLEKEVILQEIKLYQDKPMSVAQDDLYKHIFKDYTLSRPILGDKKTLDKFNTYTFINFIKKYYNKENTVISIYGDFNERSVLRELEKYTTQLKSGEKTELNNIETTYQHINYIERDFMQNTILISYTTKGYDDINYSLKQKILSIIFGRGMSSRLFLNIREQKGLTYSIHAHVAEYKSIGLFNIMSSTENEKVKELCENVDIEISKLLADGITQEELQRAKNLLKSYKIMSDTNICAKAEINLYSFIKYHQLYSEQEIFDIINAVTREEIEKTAHDIFSKPQNRVIVGKNASKLQALMA